MIQKIYLKEEKGYTLPNADYEACAINTGTNWSGICTQVWNDCGKLRFSGFDTSGQHYPIDQNQYAFLPQDSNPIVKFPLTNFSNRNDDKAGAVKCRYKSITENTENTENMGNTYRENSDTENPDMKNLNKMKKRILWIVGVIALLVIALLLLPFPRKISYEGIAMDNDNGLQ